MIRDKRVINDAVYLIDDNSFASSWFAKSAASGWDLDARSECKPEGNIKGKPLCTNEESKYDVCAVREIVPVRSGKVGFSNMFTVHYGEDFYIRFLEASDDDNRRTAFEVSALNGKVTVNGEATEVPFENRTRFYCFDFNLDNGEVLFYIDNVRAGTYKMQVNSISALVYGVKAGTKTCAMPYFTRMWVNYLLLDKCYCYTEASLYDKWSFVKNGEAHAELAAEPEGHSYRIVTEDDKSAYVTREFDRTSGKIDFEVKYATEKNGVNVGISLLDGEKCAVCINDNGEAVLSCGKALRTHHVNVWQTVRIVADSDEGNAVIYHNGKKCGNVPLTDGISAFDGIKLELQCDDGAKLKFVNTVVHKVNPEPEDYVPVPVKPKKKDYYVGINVCSLWRTGTHTGWDTITPYPENKTFLGWYDEGLAEVSDWEIKWLYENGVDFELYCWYNDRTNAPMQGTGLSDAIHNGHFKAKYGDLMKFAIIWEAAKGARTCEEGFKNHLVPYWMDHFFSDDRYFTVDNKVVVSVFGYDGLIRDFGSPEKVAESFDYVREQVKTLGYDGALFIACAAPNEKVKACGFDAVHSYSWAMGGYSPEFTKKRMSAQLETGSVHVIPTVSSGFNGIAWKYERTGQMSTEDMGEMFRWIKEEVLPQNEGEEEWKKKFVMLSTWNEYGEGTYMCPSGLNGFGYLEEIKKAFTEPDESFANVRPNDKQLERLGYLYPPYRSVLKSRFLEKREYPDKHLGYLPLDHGWRTENELDISFKDGRLFGKAAIYDPKMFMETNIDAETVKNVKITMKGGTVGDEVIIYFVTDSDGAYSEEKSARAYFDTSAEKTYDIYVGGCPLWKGTITEIRLDPTALAGEFEIESIELLADDKSIRLFVDGNECRFPSSVMMECGKAYVPYEHGGDLQVFMNTCHRWYKDEGKLYILHDEKELVFEIGKDYATFGEEGIALSKPVEMFDGLPMLDLDVMAEAFGFVVKVDGRDIYVTSK